MFGKQLTDSFVELIDNNNFNLSQFQEILDSFFAAVVIIDYQGLTVAMNLQAASLLKVDKIKARRMSLHEFLPESYKDVVRLLKSGKMTASLPVSELDNCLLQVTPFLEQKGGLLTVFDYRLWTSNNIPTIDPLTPYLRVIFESSSDGICVTNNKGVIVAVNAASAHLTGMSPSELVGKKVEFLIEEGYTDTCVSWDVINKKTSVSRLATYYKSGSQLLLTGTPVFDKHKNVKLVIINERDLTQLNKLKTDLKKAKEVNAKIRDELAALKIVSNTENLGFVVESPVSKDLLKVALKLATVGAARILIMGESGTGKGLLAKFLHQNSFRKDKPFVHVNCAALPEQLLEAELFGYEKGAFTGAAPTGKAGLFEVAQEGTVFLDEIGEMPLVLQTKLLTFLDDQTFMRLGGTRVLKANCSIIAATNQNLQFLVASKKFRADLYYRLNVFSLIIPPLRQRSEDLQSIAVSHLSSLNKLYNTDKVLDINSWQVLFQHSFPGNVRELLALLKKAVVLSDDRNLANYLKGELNGEGQVFTENENFKENNFKENNFKENKIKEIKTSEIKKKSFKKSVEETEKELLKKEVAKGKSTREIALTLNISQSTASRKIRHYGLKTIRMQKNN